LRFFSDNTGTVSPEILAALAEANHGLVSAYGNDPWTRRLDDCLSAYFGTAVRAFPVATGTAANSLTLATLSPSYGVIFAHEGHTSPTMNAERPASSPVEHSCLCSRGPTAK
jgi:threonine aldolase